MTPSAIEIEIQELVINGISIQSDGHLQAVLTTRLEQLLVGQIPSALASGGRYPSLNGGTITLPTNATTDIFGNAVGTAVYHSLGGKK